MEGLARREDKKAGDDDDAESTDPTQRKVKYSEIFVLADRDGDGIAELIRCVCAGTRYKVLEAEPWDEIDYAAFAPYPEAHVFFGTARPTSRWTFSGSTAASCATSSTTSRRL
jgi:hypothetical protein